MKTITTITSCLAATAFALTTTLSAQVAFTESFTSALKASNGAAEATLGTGGGGYSYDGNFGTWIYNAGNMGVDDPAEGNADGIGSGNAVSSIGEARTQDWRGTNARAVSVILESALFTDATQYIVSFDVIGDADGNDAGRYWLAEISGYDNSGSNYVQVDGTYNGWGNAANKPFTGFGAASVTYLADSVDNGVLLEGENVAGTTTTSFSFTYSAGTDIAFAVGTYNNIYAIDNFEISVVPEPSTLGLLAGFLALLAVSRRRR